MGLLLQTLLASGHSFFDPDLHWSILKLNSCVTVTSAPAPSAGGLEMQVVPGAQAEVPGQSHAAWALVARAEQTQTSGDAATHQAHD